jgi:hypothetical protein
MEEPRGGEQEAGLQADRESTQMWGVRVQLMRIMGWLGSCGGPKA